MPDGYNPCAAGLIPDFDQVRTSSNWREDVLRMIDENNYEAFRTNAAVNVEFFELFDGGVDYGQFSERRKKYYSLDHSTVESRAASDRLSRTVSQATRDRYFDCVEKIADHEADSCCQGLKMSIRSASETTVVVVVNYRPPEPRLPVPKVRASTLRGGKVQGLAAGRFLAVGAEVWTEVVLVDRKPAVNGYVPAVIVQLELDNGLANSIEAPAFSVPPEGPSIRTEKYYRLLVRDTGGVDCSVYTPFYKPGDDKASLSLTYQGGPSGQNSLVLHHLYAAMSQKRFDFDPVSKSNSVFMRFTQSDPYITADANEAIAKYGTTRATASRWNIEPIDGNNKVLVDAHVRIRGSRDEGWWQLIGDHANASIVLNPNIDNATIFKIAE